MGHLFSKPVHSWLLHQLRALHKDGYAHYRLHEFEAEIPLSEFLGRENAPTCHMFVVNASIQFRDLQFDGPPLRMKSSKITITIERLVVRCDDLGYNFCIKGRFTFFDVLVKVSFKLMFDRGIRVSDISAETTVKKTKTQIRFGVNGTDHSHLANTLLSIDNSQVASNLLNALFLIQKEDIKEALNQNIKEIASQYGL